MFRYRNQRGLTLIEIILALAISTLLASTVLTGRDQLRARLQFSQAIDQTVQILTTAKEESSGTVGQTNLATGGTSTSQYIFGKMVHFNNGNPDVDVSTILINGSDKIVSTTTDPYTATIPWQVVPHNTPHPDQFVIFGLDSGGLSHVYLFNSAPTVGTLITSLPPLTSSRPLYFQNNGTRTAFDTIDANGNVTRTIN